MRVAATARDVDAMHAEALETEEKIFIRRRHLLDRRAACDDDAAAALSAYDDAMRASAPFAKVDLEELRRYVTPPGLIRAVLEAASLLLGRGGGGRRRRAAAARPGLGTRPPPDWRAARAVLRGRVEAPQVAHETPESVREGDHPASDRGRASRVRDASKLYPARGVAGAFQ